MTTNNQFKKLGEIIAEALKLRNLNIKKLVELTDIPMNYLLALSDNDADGLPSAPYVRGYLIRIADVLKIDANILLRAYKQESVFRSLKVSGSADKLPFNRYAVSFAIKKAPFLIMSVFVFAIFYFFWQTPSFLGVPQIEIINPSAEGSVINSMTIGLSGKISAGDKLIINDEEVLPEESGYFKKDFSLQRGINTFEFKVRRFLGKEIKTIRQVIYQP